MKKVILSLSLAIMLIGCGGSEDKESVSNVAKVSNIGNSINGYGYYGGTTMFGSIPIEGFKTKNVLGSDYVSKIAYKYIDGVASVLFSSWYNYGTYGVSEDGKTLYEVGRTFVNEVTYIRDINSSCIEALDNNVSIQFCKDTEANFQK